MPRVDADRKRGCQNPGEIDRRLLATTRKCGRSHIALVAAQKLGIEVAEPDPYALVKCPSQLLGRNVAVMRLREAASLSYPYFLKPVVPKQFGAQIFASNEAIEAETRGLEDSTEVICSEVIALRAEARSLVLDGVIQSCSIYEGFGDVEAAARMCERIAMALVLPRACVLDVGLLDNGEWVLIEENAAWGASLNGCDAHQVLACIAHASRAK
jgi:hypothetical protein